MTKLEELFLKIALDFNIPNKSAKATVYQENDNTINIKIELLDDNTAQLESDAFKEYLKILPDDLFITTCENLGSGEIHRITDCLNSNDIEAVRSGVLKFKQAIKGAINEKIDELNAILKSVS